MDFSIERYHGNSLVLPVALTDSNRRNPISLVGATIKFRIGDITEASEGYSIARSDSAGTFYHNHLCLTDGNLAGSGLLFRVRGDLCLRHQANAIRGQADAEG